MFLKPRPRRPYCQLRNASGGATAKEHWFGETKFPAKSRKISCSQGNSVHRKPVFANGKLARWQVGPFRANGLMQPQGEIHLILA